MHLCQVVQSLAETTQHAGTAQFCTQPQALPTVLAVNSAHDWINVLCTCVCLVNVTQQEECCVTL